MHKSAMQMQHARDLQRGVGMTTSGIGTDVKPHQCQQCLKSFSSNHQLVQHIRVHTGEKPYKCSYCDRRFKQLSHVQQHTRLHTGERPYKCHLPDCGRAFIQLSNLQQHLRNHDAQVERAKNRPFHCNICGKGFATESSLRTHTSKELQLHLGVLQQHAALIGGPNATSCPICHKLFLGGESLMEHMKHTHKDPNASGVATKRRTANHPCPVCGKHYVNEGSLRKHLACHPETSQLTTSLRMWPCSVCQAVFTHEAGLLTHMEHMRMDPKHQFAAQYVLSRAAAERRERDTLLAAAAAVSASNPSLLQMGGGQNSMCPSPSAHSDSSSGGGRLSSAGSEPGVGLLNNNNINNNNNCSSKLSDIFRGAANNGHLQQYNVDDLHANRMAMVAAAAAGMQPGVDSNSASSAVQAAVVNLAAAMRIQQQQQPQSSQCGSSSVGGGPNNGVNAINAPSGMQQDDDSANAAAQAAMNAMRASMAESMMRPSIGVDPGHHQGHQAQNSPEAALRIHQAEVILRSQAEVALRLAVSQAAAVAASGNSNTGNNSNNSNGTATNLNNFHQAPVVSVAQASHSQPTLQQQMSPELSEAIRLENALRLDPRALSFSLSSHGGDQTPPQSHNQPSHTS
ncbi:zinc finger protein 358 isoform X1 [Sergentomyia squamirostris]